MKLTFGITTATLVSTVLSLVHKIPQDRGLAKRNVYYDDWSGVAVRTPPDSTFLTVIGTFVVPTISDEAETDSAVSLWVGIDGYTAESPLIQAGVNVEYADDGTEVYNVFTEWYYNGSPGPVTLEAEDFSVSPGDTITVQVTGNAGAATASAKFTKNSDEPKSFPITPADTSQVILGQNIEWVVERQVRDQNAPGDSSLLAFDTITFTSCAGNTMDGTVTFPVNVNAEAIDMLGAEGDLAATTVINDGGNGDSFTVTWQGP